jgi:hypothetical protein
MSSPTHLMSPRRCVSDAVAIALSVETASAFLHYSGVISTSETDDVDHVSVYHPVGEHPAGDQQTRDATPGYILHPTYGWLPRGTPYLALLAARHLELHAKATTVAP